MPLSPPEEKEIIVFFARLQLDGGYDFIQKGGIFIQNLKLAFPEYLPREKGIDLLTIRNQQFTGSIFPGNHIGVGSVLYFPSGIDQQIGIHT